MLDASVESNKLHGRQLKSGDALLTISLSPYSGSTMAMARYAERHGTAIVAITDDPESPIGRLAHCCVLVSRAGSPLAESMTSAMAAAEVLAMLLLDPDPVIWPCNNSFLGAWINDIRRRRC